MGMAGGMPGLPIDMSTLALPGKITQDQTEAKALMKHAHITANQ
jgi:hypothetical protein